MKDKKGKHLIYMVGQLNLTLWQRNEKDSVMWRILRVGIWRSIAVNEGGMGKGPGGRTEFVVFGELKENVLGWDKVVKK